MRRVMPMVILMLVCSLLSWAAAGCGEEADTTSATQATTATAPQTPGSAGDILGAVLKFSDLASSSPYFKQIADLFAREIISGFGDGTFKADSPVTRQQFAKMIVKTMGYPVSEADVCPFVDVPSSESLIDPLYPDYYVAVCAAQGVTVGKTATEFVPNGSITRAQLTTMVARAANLVEPPEGYSPPFGQFDNTHFPFARRAEYSGLLNGLLGIGPNYDFFSPATRGEVCVVLYNLLHNLLDN
ncbi:MAG: S-layer homology domain-containing protein [bacterium]